jgi:hypothetical protein
LESISRRGHLCRPSTVFFSRFVIFRLNRTNSVSRFNIRVVLLKSDIASCFDQLNRDLWLNWTSLFLREWRSCEEERNDEKEWLFQRCLCFF